MIRPHPNTSRLFSLSPRSLPSNLVYIYIYIYIYIYNYYIYNTPQDYHAHCYAYMSVHGLLKVCITKKTFNCHQTLLYAEGGSGDETNLSYDVISPCICVCSLTTIRGGWTRKCMTIMCIKVGAPSPYTNIILWHIWV